MRSSPITSSSGGDWLICRLGGEVPAAINKSPTQQITQSVSLERREDFAHRLHLTAARRGRHQDGRAYAGGDPCGDAVAHVPCRSEQRHVVEPAIAHERRQRVL